MLAWWILYTCLSIIVFIFVFIHSNEISTRFQSFQEHLQCFITEIPPPCQESKWLYASTYKICVKYYQQKHYDAALKTTCSAICLAKIVFSCDEDSNVLKHVKEVILDIIIIVFQWSSCKLNKPLGKNNLYKVCNLICNIEYLVLKTFKAWLVA